MGLHEIYWLNDIKQYDETSFYMNGMKPEFSYSGFLRDINVFYNIVKLTTKHLNDHEYFLFRIQNLNPVLELCNMWKRKHNCIIKYRYKELLFAILTRTVFSIAWSKLANVVELDVRSLKVSQRS